MHILKDNGALIPTLVIGSIILIASSIFFLQVFSTAYGIGEGAFIQSSKTASEVTGVLRLTVQNIPSIQQNISGTYIMLTVAMLLFTIALALFIYGQGKYDAAMKRYTALHAVLVFVYAMLFASRFASISITSTTIPTYMAVLGIGVCMSVDIYINYRLRIPGIRQSRPRSSIRIDPATPYSNIINLQEDLIGNMHGSIAIVDKHFNSGAISNLYRLLLENSKTLRVTKITVLTSREMLDAHFGDNYRDLSTELGNMGIGMEVRVMEESDSAMQHERFMLDEDKAYKIPPLNIIHKKSEHIIRVGVREAKRRYMQLYQRSTKFENLKQNGS